MLSSNRTPILHRGNFVSANPVKFPVDFIMFITRILNFRVLFCEDSTQGKYPERIKEDEYFDLERLQDISQLYHNP